MSAPPTPASLHCRAAQMRRLLAGELSAAEESAVRAHLAECPRCGALRDEGEADRARLLRDVPFDAFASGVAERVAASRARPARWALAPLALAASVALVASATLLRPRAAEEGGLRSKGGPSAQLFLRDAHGVRQLAPGDRIPKGASLLPALVAPDRRRAAVLLIEPAETTVLYEGPATAGPLPQAFEWTGTGRATLLVVLTDAPFPAASVHGRADAPRGAELLELPLVR